jgi:hypothetical protein
MPAKTLSNPARDRAKRLPKGRRRPPCRPSGTNGTTRLALFTTLATLGTPQDVTAQEIRIECFFPADGPSAEVFKTWAASGGPC